jgi:hypothetical protein
METKQTTIMKTYKVFEKGGQKVAVKQGWSWPGFFFHFIWAFTKNLVLAGAITLVVGIILVSIMDKAGISGSPALILGLPFGIKGNKWWEAKLLKHGYNLLGTVQAKNPADALTSIPPKPEFPSINADSPVAGSFHPNAPEKKFP